MIRTLKGLLFFLIAISLNVYANTATINTTKFEKIKTPTWVLKLFKSIDELNTSKNSGFSCFSKNVQMQFGQQNIKGISNLKHFFIKIDSPLKTTHRVSIVWKIKNIIMLQGYVTLRKKKPTSAAHGKKFLFFNIFWLNKKDKVFYYSVAIPPSLQQYLMNTPINRANK